MKVIRVKLQQQTARPIKDNQKDYYFACPIKDIAVGNAVLVAYSVQRERRKKDVRRGQSTYTAVGRVEEIYEGKPWDMMEKFHPTASAVCKLETKVENYDDFWNRLKKSKNMAASLHQTYDQQKHNKAEVIKTRRRAAFERQQEERRKQKELNRKKNAENMKRHQEKLAAIAAGKPIPKRRKKYPPRKKKPSPQVTSKKVIKEEATSK